MLERINDNAYLLGELDISQPFNVADLASFDVGEPVLGSEPFQEGVDDEEIKTDQIEEAKPNEFHIMREPPQTRSRDQMPT